jgi:glycosyltransferase involved in cell wall biosynthesis
MKKILILANHDMGLYNFRKELLQELIAKGYHVFISLPNGERVKDLMNFGCEFIETPIDRRGINPKKDMSLFFHYLKVMRKIKPNIVLTYTIKPNLYGGVACRILKLPCINNITGLGSGFSRDSLLKSILTVMYKVCLKRSRCIFFQNQADMKLLVDNGIVKAYSEQLPGSGVNLNDYPYQEMPNGDVITFSFIGRIMKDKGIDQFLEAAKYMRAKYPNTRFRIVGFVEESQPYYNDYIQQYQKQGIIEFLGFQKDVKPFIEETHCIVQPSHGGEGLSNVLLENAATGRALIASNIPGCRETVNEGENGYIFEARNSEHLIEKMEQFLHLTADEKLKMGKHSRRKVEKEFDRNFVIKAYLNKISQIC